MPKKDDFTLRTTLFGQKAEIGFSATPGDPGHGPTYSCGGCPPSGPEVEFGDADLIIRDSQGKDIRVALEDWYEALTEDEINRLTDEAIEETANAIEDAMADRAEAKAEALMEARLERESEWRD